MRKWSLVVAVALGMAVVAIALAPFGRPQPRGSLTYGGFTESAHCASPVVGAFRHEPATGGWFGYAPLTSTPFVGPGSCQPAARHRLELAGVLALGAALLVIVPRRRFRGIVGRPPAPEPI